jgi:hypothetical protein
VVIPLSRTDSTKGSNTMKRHAVITCAVAAAAMGALTFTGIASAAPAAPAASCTANGSWSTVNIAVKVYASHSTTSKLIGTVARGATWHYCNGEVLIGTTDWQYGYGYNGSTKLTGWVDSSHLAHP